MTETEIMENEYSTGHNFNVQLHKGQWIMIRPNPSAPHASTNPHAANAAEMWRKLNIRKREEANAGAARD